MTPINWLGFTLGLFVALFVGVTISGAAWWVFFLNGIFYAAGGMWFAHLLDKGTA